MEHDLAKQMAAEGARQAQPTSDGLKTVQLLAEEQLKLEAAIIQAEAVLKSLTEKHKLVSEQKLPTALEEFGLSEVKLADGKKIIIKPYVSCSIKSEDQEAAFNWLRENGFGDLIKRTLSAGFGKGEDDKAEALLSELVKAGYNVEDKTGVHNQTLKAFVKEQIDAGNEELPKELFNVYEGKKSVIK